MRIIENMKKNKLVFGVGINDSDYVIHDHEIVIENGRKKYKIIWCCPFYRVWTDMLRRCFSSRVKKNQVTYKGVTCCEEWLTFSKFKAWMETQEWEGNELDKDLLIEGNKLYSPETCVFVSRKTNNFLHTNESRRGEYLIGVYKRKDSDRYESYCRNPFTGKQEFLGSFLTELEAHLTWKSRKHALALELADTQNDPRIADILRNKFI